MEGNPGAAKLVDVVSRHGPDGHALDRHFIARFHGLDLAGQLLCGLGRGHDDRIRFLDPGYVGRIIAGLKTYQTSRQRIRPEIAEGRI
jgi:hypothetical protein